MSDSFEDVFQKVKSLVADFQANEEYFLSPEYDESTTRQRFIDEFFKALGWNLSERNPHRQEVKIEKTVSQGKKQKRADYAFFIPPNYRDTVLIAEAKKPSRNLYNPDDYFQTARYGYFSTIPIAILFDFEELHILDCRDKPIKKDILKRQLKKYHYTDFSDAVKFKEIFQLFSREAIFAGSIGNFIGNYKRPYKPLDEALLDELDSIRDQLARSIKKRNPKLESEPLTEAVQRIINRLVLFRFLEDKLIEQEYYISKFSQSKTAWNDFVSECARLEAKYNGIVFRKHFIDEENFKSPEQEIFCEVCKQLSHSNEEGYDFDVIPIPILGSIYERFLGKVVHATAIRVKVEEKKEVRKAEGVYYTPQYIVNYIVENTIGQLIAGKTPGQISHLRFADIACGSGSFLISVYDFLLHYHSHWYYEHPKEAKKDGCIFSEDKISLSLELRKNILLNNIYGVDIDQQAVEVTQLSLYLKLLEENGMYLHQVLFKEKILPDLSKNIICGNSLVERDINENLFDKIDENKVNPMSFKHTFSEIMNSGGFDAILGNPPYIDSETMVKKHPFTREYCTAKYKTAKGNWDMYCVFCERAITLLKENGKFGYIIPNKFLSAPYGIHLKKFISSYQIRYLADYSSVSVFISQGKKVNIYPVVLIIDKQAPGSAGIYLMMKQENKLQCLFQKKFHIKPEEINWTQKFDPQEKLLSKIEKDSVRIDKHFSVENAATVAEAYELKKLIEDKRKTRNEIYFVNTGTIDRYESLWGIHKTQYIKNAYANPVVNKEMLKKKFPKRYHQSVSEKIILAGMVKELETMYDEGETLAGKSTVIIQNKTNQYSLKFILGIINSKLLCTIFFSKNKHNAMSGEYMNVSKDNISELPFIEVNLKNTSEKSLYDKMIKLVDEMLSAKKELVHSKTNREKLYYERKCNEIDKEIDALVFKLYV